MTSIKASVYIICHNEEQHIVRLLENIKDFDEVILVDSGSNDNTLTIAKNFPNVHIFHQPWLGYAKQKAFALSKCKNTWVLNLDADEVISNELRGEIKNTIALNNCDALMCQLLEVFLDKPSHRFAKHADKIRFFKRTQGYYNLNALVHESISVKGKICNAKGVIYHYGLSSIEMMISKNNKYSTLAAKMKFAQHKHASTLKMIFIFFWAFFRAYFLKRFFLNGVPGFIHSMSIGFYAFLKEAKLYEMNREKAKKSCLGIAFMVINFVSQMLL